MAAYARDLLNYKYYKDTDGGKIEKAKEIIEDEKNKDSSKIHYIFSASAVILSNFIVVIFYFIVLNNIINII